MSGEAPHIDDIISPDHFPTCSCFSGQQAEDSRVKMYQLTNALAQQIFMNLYMNNFCPSSMPKALAMIFHSAMCVTVNNTDEFQVEEMTDEKRAEYGRKVGVMTRDVMVEMEALLRRTVRITHSDAKGGEIVQ